MIEIFSENTDLPRLPFPKIKKWIKLVIGSYSFKPGDISIIFCTDDYLLSINQNYLNHDYYTDIITFNYNSKKVISGDIFISVDTVKLNSVEFNSTEQDEFLRVIIHGILHLLGFNDQNEIETQQMRMKENEALDIF